MKTKEKTVNPFITAMILIILIMSAALFFRLMAAKAVYTTLGEDYIDPETDVPYLTEMDSYYHLRMTRDIREHSHPGNELKDGEPWDGLSYAPYGRSAAGYSPLMAYIAVFFSGLLSSFGNITLEKVVYWQGAFLSVLVVIPVFIMAYRMQGMIAAFTAAVLASLNYGYFLHTVPGFYDTDTVLAWSSTLFFCLACLLISSFTENKEGSKTKVKRAVYAGAFFLSFLVLILSWNVYTLFMGILALSLLLFSALFIKTDKKSIREKLTGPGTALVLILLGVLILDRGFITNLLSQLTGVFPGNGSGLFPDAYMSVSEMRKPSLIAGGLTGLFQMKVLSGNNIGVINAVGGSVCCIMALVMWVMLIRGIFKGERRFDLILLVVWYFLTAILAFRSWRFIMLFAVPTAILSGILVGKICAIMKDRKMMDWQAYAVMLILLAIFPALYGAYRSVGDSFPQVNRYLHEPLSSIRSNTGADTIIASWWDYGYFYEEKTGRRIIFDGGSQNGMRIYWIGKSLATKDEKLSRNIIKMLSGSGDQATERMIKAFGESTDTLVFMNELLSSDRDFAEAKLLERGLSPEEAAGLAELIFPEVKEEVLFIITHDMLNIAQWFARFGFYGEEGALSEDDYALVFNDLEYKPEKGKAAWRFTRNGETIDLFIEEEDGVCKAHTEKPGKEGESIPIDRIIKRENNMAMEYGGSGTVSEGKGWTILLDMDAPSPVVTVITSPLYESVFGRLYFQGGSGMEHYAFSDLSGGSAFVYNVN